MHDEVDAGKCSRDSRGRVFAGVVDDDDLVDNFLGHDLGIGPIQRARCVVSRHDHDDFFAL